MKQIFKCLLKFAAVPHSGVTLGPKEQRSPEMHWRMRLGEEEASGSQRLLTGEHKPRCFASVRDEHCPALPCGIQLSWAAPVPVHVFACLLFPELSCSFFLTDFSWGDLPQQTPHRRIPVSSSVSEDPT